MVERTVTVSAAKRDGTEGFRVEGRRPSPSGRLAVGAAVVWVLLSAGACMTGTAPAAASSGSAVVGPASASRGDPAAKPAVAPAPLNLWIFAASACGAGALLAMFASRSRRSQRRVIRRFRSALDELEPEQLAPELARSPLSTRDAHPAGSGRPDRQGRRRHDATDEGEQSS